MAERKTSALTERELAKVDAEAERAAAEARKFKAEAELAEHDAALGLIQLKEAQHKRKVDLAGDEHHYVYRFNGGVAGTSVAACIKQLSTWHRINPKCDITLVLNSPGGEVIAGLALWDFLIELKETHHLKTVARGYAASMAGILLQAGHERVMGAEASLLIHEASFGAGGSMGDVEDTVEWIRKLQDRILDIFAARSHLTKGQIKRRWRRKDWWLTSVEAEKFGFVDKVGGGGVV